MAWRTRGAACCPVCRAESPLHERVTVTRGALSIRACADCAKSPIRMRAAISEAVLTLRAKIKEAR